MSRYSTMTDQEKQIAEKLSLIWWPEHATTNSSMKQWGIAKFKEVAQAAIEEIDKAVEKEREQSHLFAEWLFSEGWKFDKDTQWWGIMQCGSLRQQTTAELRTIFNDLKEGK